MRTYKFNILAIPLIILCLWTGFTNRVPWWTIALIGLSQTKLELTWKR